MDSRSACVAIRGLHRDEVALNLGDSALYHMRGRLSFDLGLEVRLRPKTCGAAIGEQEDSCCYLRGDLWALPTNHGASSHNTS